MVLFPADDSARKNQRNDERESDEVYLSYIRFYFYSFMIDLAKIKTMIQSGEAYLAFIGIHFC